MMSARAPQASVDWSIRQSSPRGGDFAGVVKTGTRAAFFVGDVTGHGATAFEKARTIEARVMELLALGLMPSAILQRVDTTLQFGDGFGPFATLFLALADHAKRVLWYSSAGHPTALVFSGRHHTHLDPTGPLLGLGMREPSAFVQRIISLPISPVLVAVTDGITDARCARRPTDFFGSSGVEKAYRCSRPRSAANAIYEASEAFAGGFEDDATVLVASLDG